MEKDDLVHIGRIGKTFGTLGEVIIDPAHKQVSIIENEPVFLGIEGTRVPFFLTTLKERSDGRFLAGFDGINSPEEATPLLNAEVFIERSSIPEPEEGMILISDLVGFTASDEVYGILGIISEIQEYPEQDMLVIRSETAELLIPLVEDFIVSLDLETTTIHLNTPAGLIDLLRENP